MAKWRTVYVIAFIASLSFYGVNAFDTYEPTVMSDKDDYAPGEVAIITGYGWTQDSLVDIHLEEDPAHDHHHDYHDTKVNPDGTWRIEYPIEDRHLGVAFTVIVLGKHSGVEARTYFTDAPSITNITPNIGPTLGNTEVTISGKGLFVTNWDLKIKFGELLATEKPNSRTTSGQGGSQTQSVTVYAPAQAAGVYDVKAIMTKTSGQFQVEESEGVKYTYTKSSATLSLSNLIHTYNGDAKSAIITTNPAGLSGVNITYNGSTTAPTNAGSYEIVATLENANYEALPVSRTLIINKATASVTLGDLEHVYSGSPKFASATTDAIGASSLRFTYDGVAEQPVNFKEGGYSVVATLVNQNFDGSATGTLMINKAAATVAVNGKTVTYNGQAHGATGTATGVNNEDLSASLDLGASFTDAPGGTASWRFSGNENYNAANGTVQITINKATAVLTLGNLAHTYDGTIKYATAVTAPAGLSGISISNNGKTNAGRYLVTVTLDNKNYAADDVTGYLVIDKADQVISWPNPANIVYGTVLGNAQLNASALESATLTYSPVAGTVLGAGPRTLTVYSTETDNYKAGSKEVTLVVEKASSSVAVTGDNTFTYSGNAQGPATSTKTGSTGAVTYSYSGTSNGGVTYAASATAPTLAGSYSVVATLTGDDNNNGATSEAFVFTIDKATAMLALGDLTHVYDGTVKNASATTLPAGLSGVIISNNGNISAGTYGVEAILENDNYRATPVKGSLIIINPSISIVTGPTDPISIYSPDVKIVKLSTNLIIGNSVRAKWDCGDGVTHNATLVNGYNEHIHEYKSPGVHRIKLALLDVNNVTIEEKQFEYVVVYDPDGSFVTGGGWFESPESAVINDLNGKIKKGVKDKAHFGFNSKYSKGKNTPDGSAQFQFKAGGLEFNSHTNDWLVVSGATAKYKGVGKIKDDSRDFGFMIYATDGEVNGKSNSDKFRIKIWLGTDESVVVYDNAPGDDDLVNVLPIGGGSIVVHENKSVGKTTTSSKLITEGKPALHEQGNFYNYPNSFSDRTIIAFSLSKEESYALEVYDVKGALVKKVSSGVAEANKLYEFEVDGRSMAEGIYIARLVTSSRSQSIKMILKK